MSYNILFDLDGTLTDSGEGITRSAQYALSHFGIDVPDHQTLGNFVGPPLTESFADPFGLTGADAITAIEKFREYYKDKGIHQNILFPGIPQMLATLAKQGHTLHVATSKPTHLAIKILDTFSLSGYFQDVEGSPPAHAGKAKADVITALIQRRNISPSTAIMVGDRKHDIIGAQKTGMSSVGVLYGYGSEEELSAAGATHIVPTVQALADLLSTI